MRERRPVHERFFAARPWSFLAGGLLPLACVRNFAAHRRAPALWRAASTGWSICACGGRVRRGAGSFGARRVTQRDDQRQYDRVVRAANRHGISLMRTMKEDPRWPADPSAEPAWGTPEGGAVRVGNPFRVEVGP